ncbi:hypothetical protein MVEN_01227400 [Mycena venus]|uniref:Uncharacterized protein n=1 Tax=Mycena venus TaxID=2733690 RepID=A0A8H7CZ02_9AGAR|nr:hypothetical protein MVEN_01227400 [Mycena venus]
MEEDIDNETLQAQIDLSLSYAQNLVSSWVKPSTNSKPTKNSKQALEAELKEYMRRPPRLGVGAPIPEVAASSSRDTERLKSHLSGKGSKRTRGDDDNEPGSKQLSDNEEDSRGASTKKKARIDPFEASSKKKKKEKEAPKPPTPPPPEKKITAKETSTEEAGKSEDVLQTSEPVSPPVSSSKRKKKHKNKNPLQVGAGSESLPVPNSSKASPVIENVNGHINDSSIPKSRQAVPQNGKAWPAMEPIDISLLTSTPASPASHAHDHHGRAAQLQNSPPLLKGPILNLTGPPPSPSDNEESGEDNEPGTGSPSSPKKKRRRRKKKKSLLGGPRS